MIRELLWALTMAAIVYADYKPSPLAVPITNVFLKNHHLARGILGTIGTPPQNISFNIHHVLNDAWIYSQNEPFCPNNVTIAQCETLRGGFYESRNSSSFRPVETFDAAGDDCGDGAPTLETPISLNTWATDVFTVGDAPLDDFPVGIPGMHFDQSSGNQAILGLGRHSTLLERLKSSGRITSRSWSFWFGVDKSGSSPAIDGQVVLGGYDKAKVIGAPLTQPLQTPSARCQSGMVLNVTSMLLKLTDGTSVDINPSSILSACISPAFPAIMTIPFDPLFLRFEDVTHARPVDHSQGSSPATSMIPPANVYSGDLQMRIEGGPVVTLSHDELVMPEHYVDSTGITRSNTSSAVLHLVPFEDTDADEMTLIGARFFSSAYLTVNYDNETWSLWQANPTTDSNLISIRDSGCERAAIKRRDYSDGTSDGYSVGLSTSAIVGIVIGALCLKVALIGSIIIYIRRRRRARRAMQTAAVDGTSPDLVASIYNAPKNAVETTRSAVQAPIIELAAQRDPAELSPDGRVVQHKESATARVQAVELPVAK